MVWLEKEMEREMLEMEKEVEREMRMMGGFSDWFFGENVAEKNDKNLEVIQGKDELIQADGTEKKKQSIEDEMKLEKKKVEDKPGPKDEVKNSDSVQKEKVEDKSGPKDEIKGDSAELQDELTKTEGESATNNKSKRNTDSHSTGQFKFLMLNTPGNCRESIIKR